MKKFLKVLNESQGKNHELAVQNVFDALIDKLDPELSEFVQENYDEWSWSGIEIPTKSGRFKIMGDPTEGSFAVIGKGKIIWQGSGADRLAQVVTKLMK